MPHLQYIMEQYDLYQQRVTIQIRQDDLLQVPGIYYYVLYTTHDCAH